MGTFTSELIFGEYAYGTMTETPNISYKTLLYNGFSPLSLFAASEPGFWFDPSDLSTLFQDTAGTTPVTVAGQSVARINDKSGRGNHATQSTSLSRPTYQVDSNGRGYLSFDGSDDFLVTPTITPGTDKAQAFAGVRKLSDAATGAVIELSASGSSGSISVFAPLSAAANYEWRSFGTGVARATSGNTFAAPITNVLTGIGEISTDTAILRVNGAQAATSPSDQGTGNYNNYPLYIGRRGDTAYPFNGRIYSLICRFGSNLAADQITQTEAWVNSKTGAY